MARERTGKQKAKAAAMNLLEMVPHRACRAETDAVDASNDAGIVHVIVPKFRTRVGSAFCHLLRRPETYRLNLDAFGSAVWSLIDGERTVETIGALLRERFGDEVEPLYPRLSSFLQQLEREAAISLHTPDGDP